MKTPVVLIIFNRPDSTARVFEAIAAAKPEKLFVAADGPRPNRPDDVERCAAARAVIERVDWECELLTDFSDVNLGCKARPLTAVNWVFEQVEEAIILEDDCLPHPSFFRYCEELLSRFSDDERVMMISGYNFFGRMPSPRQSYFFSLLGCTWGWATWRRAWRLNDPDLDRWPLVARSKLIESLFPDPVHTRYWYDIFAQILNGKLPDAWDYQWQLACWANSGFRIFPETSLISNLGFGEDATHTFGENPFDNRALGIDFPLRHPELVTRCFEADMKIVECFCQLDGYRNQPSPPSGIVRRMASRLAGRFGGH